MFCCICRSGKRASVSKQLLSEQGAHSWVSTPAPWGTPQNTNCYWQDKLSKWGCTRSKTFSQFHIFLHCFYYFYIIITGFILNWDVKDLFAQLLRLLVTTEPFVLQNYHLWSYTDVCSIQAVVNTKKCDTITKVSLSFLFMLYTTPL